MRFLIDGYNLLHATDLFGTGRSAGTLQGSREALLDFLAAALSAAERRVTTIVFDAASAPPGLPRTVHHQHLTVRYAREYTDADALLEEIIERHRAPKGLLVVSSDHRVQRAARHRGSKYVDSDRWYRELVIKRRGLARRDDRRPTPGGSVDYWVDQFTTAEIEELEQQLKRTTARHYPPPAEQQTAQPPPPMEPGFENPFPPGYADDLLDDEEPG